VKQFKVVNVEKTPKFGVAELISTVDSRVMRISAIHSIKFIIVDEEKWMDRVNLHLPVNLAYD
jgi:hypothetical protein